MQRKTINSAELFRSVKGRSRVDWECLIEHLFVEYLPSKEDVKRLIEGAAALFSEEPNLLYLEDPITIVGDIHGQFHDMKEIFRLGGLPTLTKYLFLGDYVDRGAYGIEVLLAIYALKINHPNTVFLLRGNHECRQMTVFHDFRSECLRKYDQEVYELLMDSFDKLPIGCIINGQFLAVHGGISPDTPDVLDINRLERFCEPPQFGAICDLLWADPVDSDTGAQEVAWKFNASRNCSYYFGAQAVGNFLRKNTLMTIIRAHEAQFEGFKAYVWEDRAFPQVITVFSAPNYCGTYANKGSLLRLSGNSVRVYQYSFSVKPDLLLHLGDAFSWSVPLLSKALMDMFVGFLGFTNDALTAPASEVDISTLDDTVLNAIELHRPNRRDLLDNSLTGIERLVEEQKQRKKLSTGNISRRIHDSQGLLSIAEENSRKDDSLNTSVPETFELRKFEDKANESRPFE